MPFNAGTMIPFDTQLYFILKMQNIHIQLNNEILLLSMCNIEGIIKFLVSEFKVSLSCYSEVYI